MADERASHQPSFIGHPDHPARPTTSPTHGTGMRSHRVSLSWLVLALLPASALGQESYKIEALKEPPPAGLSAAVRGVLTAEGYRVVDGAGKTYAEVWLRKAVPASEKPGAPKGAVQFPFLAEGG